MAPKVPSYTGFTPSSPTASRVKQANRREGGKAERLLGKALWRSGLRYRKHAPNLPGRPDFVFAGPRVCVFCDGDFWHGRDWDTLRERLARRANPAYWLAKIGRNVERDREQGEHLTAWGWLVLRFWETDVLRDPEAAALQVKAIVESRRASGVGARTP
ncbi:MAG: very short patch repair endonuclease [Chloroflexota bacterium]